MDWTAIIISVVSVIISVVALVIDHRTRKMIKEAKR